MESVNERNNGMFKPGQSGNPSGRPKADKTIRDLARLHTEDAIRTLVEIANNPKTQAAVRVQAANALLDRAWGKPVQYAETHEQSVNASIVATVEPKVEQCDLEERIRMFTEKRSLEHDMFK